MAIDLDGITLPEDLIWADEYGWSKVSQDIKKSLTGKLIIQEASQTKGRKFTLTGDAGSAWIEKTTLDLIQAKIDTINLNMTLNYHGVNYNVMFNRSGENVSPIDTQPIYELSDPQGDHVYSITLKFIEV